VDFGWLLVFGVFWIIFSAIREGSRSVKRAPRRREELRDAFAATSPGLRELLDAIEQAARPTGTTAPRPPVALPREAELDDFTSLESTDAEVVVERAPSRAVREDVDLDEQSIAIAARRREHADRLATPPRATPGRTVRMPEPAAADATAVATPPPVSPLRQAVIWREILGPPPSLRGD
jgi:hypothetical protein